MEGVSLQKHTRFEDADPNSVIVTLYRAQGMVRGWFIGPPSFKPSVPMNWQTSEQDNMLGAVALVRALEIATLLQIKMSLVDPDNLWTTLTNTVVS